MNTDSLIQPRIVLKFKSSSWSLRVKVFFKLKTLYGTVDLFSSLLFTILIKKKSSFPPTFLSCGYNRK